jgi:CubicO group peptidase (beta-lactamase class C family)
MTNTYVQLPEAKEDRMVVGHNEKGDTAQRWHNGVLIGDGGLVSTASDLVNFLAAQLRPDTTKYTKSIQGSHKITDEKETGVAYGWMVKRSDTSSVYWRNGKTGGYSSFWGFNEGKEKGVVLLANGRINQDVIGEYLVS